MEPGVRAARPSSRFTAWVPGGMYCPWITTMSSGHDVSESKLLTSCTSFVCGTCHRTDLDRRLWTTSSGHHLMILKILQSSYDPPDPPHTSTQPLPSDLYTPHQHKCRWSCKRTCPWGGPGPEQWCKHCEHYS